MTIAVALELKITALHNTMLKKKAWLAVATPRRS